MLLVGEELEVEHHHHHHLDEDIKLPKYSGAS